MTDRLTDIIDAGRKHNERTHAALQNLTPEQRRILIRSGASGVFSPRADQDPKGERPEASHPSDRDPGWVMVHASDRAPEATPEQHTTPPTEAHEPEGQAPEVGAEADSDWLMVTGSGDG